MIDWLDLCERQLGQNSCFQLQQKRLGRRDIVMHLQRLLCESVSPAVAHVSTSLRVSIPLFSLVPGLAKDYLVMRPS